MPDFPEYVFRGTTLGFSGNQTSMNIPMTCTSSSPLVVTLFALVSKGKFGQQSVVYVAKTEDLIKVATIGSQNVLGTKEKEFAWNISPIGFTKLCIGYLHLEQMQDCLRNLAIETPISLRLDELSGTLERIKNMDSIQIQKLIENIIPLINN